MDREKLKSLILGLITPRQAPVQAEQAPPSGIVQMMANRQQALQQMPKPQTGGMFDMIYKKRKEREDALKDIGL